MPLFLSMLALVLWPAATAAQTPDPRMVEVGGYPVRVRVAGTDRSGPTVVLEAAFREPLQSWDAIFNEIAALAPSSRMTVLATVAPQTTADLPHHGMSLSGCTRF